MKEPEMAIPPLFRCPISLDLFKDPVTLCTGQTYDRSSIEKWLSSGNSTCPVTMQKLHDSSIVPNHTLRHLIHQWLQLNCRNGYDLHYFQAIDDSIVGLKHNLQSKESTLDTKVQALEKVLALSEDLPLENSFLIQLDFFQMILELALENSVDQSSNFQESLIFMEKALVCALKLLPFSDLGTLNMLKEDESKFTNFLMLFKNGTFIIKKSLCHLIVAISSSLQSKELVTMLGKSKIFIQELVHVIENKLDGCEESIRALSALSSLEQNREFIVKENAVEALITYIVNAPKCQYRSLLAPILAMKTIETLLVEKNAKEDVLNHPNGVSAIVKMVFRVSSDNEGSESAVNSLIIVCHDFMQAREEAIYSGVLSQLLLLLQSQCSERTKNKARMLLKLLRSMCTGDQKQAL
ncbi:U-box domain-containing protein 25-like [Nicotiana tabacum]|uniref:U-box domain-containing protein n=1 Tax=Nicotiana tabacum TaxID=4097 RepID=A0A1S4AGM2_TOBAC|nr:PREDICTED: U-box domain-containing protein 25-like [Nicotiana tabacum]